MYHLGGDADGRVCACGGGRYVGIPLPSSQFCCQSKTSLKSKVYFKKQKEVQDKCESAISMKH